ncbi:CTRA protein, partial [Rostratula benghalensis]|nr:CTRA protein [Rostratula benghalensis]
QEELATRLQEAETSLLSHQACANYWGQNIEEANISGGDVEAGFFAWYGDSGWPLTCVNDRHYKLAGISSWGSDKCHQESPIVYPKVSACGHWISAVTS